MYKFVFERVKYYTMSKLPKSKKGSVSSVVSEPAIAYDHMFRVLKGAADKPETRLSSFEKMEVVKEGISKTDLEVLKAKAGMDYTELANALSVTRATLINKKKSEKFGLAVSEKILDIAELYSFGFEVFNDEEAFRNWMDTPVRALGFQKPSAFIDNQFGRQEVRNLIGRIAYGVYS